MKMGKPRRVTGSKDVEVEIVLDKEERLRLIAQHLMDSGVEVREAAAGGNKTAQAIMMRGTWEN